MREARINATAGIAGILVSIGLWFLIDYSIHDSATFAGNSPMLTSRFFPRFATCLLALASFACLGGSLLTLSRARKEETRSRSERILSLEYADKELMPEDSTLASEFRVLGLLALFFLNALLFHPIGHLYSSLIVSALVLALLGCRKWKYYAISWAFCGLIYLVFTRLLYVPLP